MKNQSAIKQSPVILSIFLFSFTVFYVLLEIFSYKFVPYNSYLTNIISALIIVGITVIGYINKKEKTFPAALFSAFLPLIAISSIFIKLLVSELSNADTTIYIVHSCITLLCSIILFFCYGRKKAIVIVLSIAYSILLVPAVFFIFVIIIFSNYIGNTVVKTQLSPSAVYLAEITDNDQGAMGGSTLVSVTKQSQDIDLLAGTLKTKPKIIYTGRWREFENMTLNWESDDILYINDIRYEMK